MKFRTKILVCPVSKECKHLDASDIDCESVSEIPDIAHLTIVLDSLSDIHCVRVYETRNLAEQYAHLAGHFKLEAAVFVNIPIRDSYAGLDQSYVRVEAKKHRIEPSSKESHPPHVATPPESTEGEQVFENVD